MKRRELFRLLPGLAAWPWLAGSALGLSACSGRDGGSGPVEVVWDRDTCERCGMVISDRFHAAQLRDAEGRPHRFDDLGCALYWRKGKGLDGQEREFWITDFRHRSWIDARQARYAGGRSTPMGYGYGGTLDAIEPSVTLAEASADILSRGK